MDDTGESKEKPSGSTADLQAEILHLKQELAESSKLQKQLNSEKARYLSLIDCSTDVVWRIDLNGVFTFVSKVVDKVVGYKAEELIGKHISFILSEDSYKIAMESLKKRNEGILENRSRLFELVHKHKNGREFPCEVRTAPVLNSSGETIEIQGYSRDITSLKEAEEQLDMYREQVNQAERLATMVTISATVAHELNQPLTVIRLLLQDCLLELSEKENCEKIVEDINDSLIEVHKASQTIQRFRDVAKPLRESPTVYDYDSSRLLDKIVSLMSKTARRSGLQLIISSDIKEVLSYSEYLYDIEQVFFILIENAIQAVDGKKNRLLKINGYLEDDKIVLTFADDCGGIDPENIDSIFNPFFTTKPDGMGLGLSIVKRIMDVVGGKISVESKFGYGSTFYVRIPAKESEGRAE